VAQTAAEAAVMESTATKFESTRESLDSMLSRLLGELEILSSHWQGQSGRKFTDVKMAYEANQKKLSSALGETALAIRNSGTTYTSTDETSSASVGSINTNLSLPL
jgi:WXG100 family type VII secretion target